MTDSTRTETRLPLGAFISPTFFAEVSVLELDQDQAGDRDMVTILQQRSFVSARLAKRNSVILGESLGAILRDKVSGDRGYQGHKPSVHGVGPRTRELDPDEAAANVATCSYSRAAVSVEQVQPWM